MAKILYDFLPGSGSRAWKGHVSFKTVAQEVGVGDFWPVGSKQPAIATLLERTLERRRWLLEPLIVKIVRAGLTYRDKQGHPITESEITTLNGLILEVGFKIPSLWDTDFISSLRANASSRAAELVEREAAVDRIRQSCDAEATKRRDELRRRFYELAKQENRQAAGRELENVLTKLFELEGLSPQEPFRVVGEQIDGSFELDSEVYLLEAKWEAERVSEAPLLVFGGKVQGKSSITRGLFIALNGWTGEALDAITRGKQPNFLLMNGHDLATVLEGTLRLDALLRAKVRHLAERGEVFLSVSEVISARKGLPK